MVDCLTGYEYYSSQLCSLLSVEYLVNFEDFVQSLLKHVSL